MAIGTTHQVTEGGMHTSVCQLRLGLLLRDLTSDLEYALRYGSHVEVTPETRSIGSRACDNFWMTPLFPLSATWWWWSNGDIPRDKASCR